jgi:hypothetical protein
LTAFPEWPLWHEIAGGGWTYGTTYHPEYSPAMAVAVPNHPLTVGLDELAIADERYHRAVGRLVVTGLPRARRWPDTGIRWPGRAPGVLPRSLPTRSGTTHGLTRRPVEQASSSANWLVGDH